MVLKAGLIGCGGLGRQHSQCLKELEGMRMAAFCDVIDERAEGFAREFDGDYWTTDCSRLFEDNSLDAIYVCTQHDSHAELAISAAKAGKHIMMEKPLALTVADCLSIRDAVESHRVKLMTAFKMRYYAMILKAKELIPNPLVITMQMMDKRWLNRPWQNDPTKGGGNVLSQGVHSCDILRFVANSDPADVFATGGNYYEQSGVVDNLVAVFRFENGAAGSWVQGDCNVPPVTSKFFMQVFAEGKALTLYDRFCTLAYSEKGKKELVFQGSETGFIEENRAFIEAIQHDAPMPIDHIDGLFATMMVLQAFASLKSGRAEPIAALIGEKATDTDSAS